jgi:hypothetical protein
MKQKKNHPNSTTTIIIVLLIGGFLFYFTQMKQNNIEIPLKENTILVGPNITSSGGGGGGGGGGSGSSSGTTSINEPFNILQLKLWDINKNLIDISNRQSTIGGISGVEYISFDTIIFNIGNIQIQDIYLASIEPIELRRVLSSKTISVLLPGQQTNWSSGLISIEQLEGRSLNFSVTVQGKYFNESGFIENITKMGIRSLEIRPDICTDGTPWDTCSNSKPQKCINGTLVNKASLCGCNSGYDVIGENCIAPACFNTTAINTCMPSKPDYCNGVKQVIPNCGLCGCNNDYYNNLMVCNSTIGTCNPRDYNIDFVVLTGY